MEICKSRGKIFRWTDIFIIAYVAVLAGEQKHRIVFYVAKNLGKHDHYDTLTSIIQLYNPDDTCCKLSE